MIRRIIFLVYYILHLQAVYAQFIKESHLTGSLESNTHFYFDDAGLEFDRPGSPFATNNYLMLDYRYRFIEAGIQYENYLPPLIGFANQLEGHRLVKRFLSIKTDRLLVTLGHFYEQFGNGLVLRTYEDRALGINTSLDEKAISWNQGRLFRFKGFGARQLGYLRHGNE